MGYTVTIHPTTPKLGKKMLAFMEEHSRTLGAVTGEGTEDIEEYPVCPLPSKDLSYCNRRGHIGFDYGSVALDRVWVYMLIHWMAIKVGRRAKSGNAQYFYDGVEWIDVNPKKYDRLGRPRKSFLRSMPGRFLYKNGWSGKFFEEIGRLDKLWAAYIA